MRRQYASRAFAVGLLSSCALLLGCTRGDVGTAVQSITTATPDAGARDAGTCQGDCQALGLVCHPRRLVCVECLEDAECASFGAPFCDRGRGECIECREHIHCPRATPLCSFGHCSVCPDGRDHDGVCDFDPRCSGRDCDDDTPGQRGSRFGADPDDRDSERSPTDAGP
jgi:hypothetical protein